ncbi:MAG: FAD-dependent oxidoreductase, partial [Oceanospirillum sp.]|nr:FAD-dependent oxidoreductase [Oceanospirillum sp.]
MSQVFQHDVLIIGSGAAGLSLALQLADHCSVAVLSKSTLEDGSTRWAQGGIAAVLDNDDSVESHVQDTLIAGADLCDEDAVRFTVENSKKSIDWLINQGVPFTPNDETDSDQPYHLTREGGHSHRRIIHAADATGREVERALLAQVEAHEGIEVYEYHYAVDLITEHHLGQHVTRVRP